MSIITNFPCLDQSDNAVPCDAFGNNVALRCPRCGYPILAIARPHQRGADANNPAECRGCELRCWIEVENNRLRLIEVATPR